MEIDGTGRTYHPLFTKFAIPPSPSVRPASKIKRGILSVSETFRTLIMEELHHKQEMNLDDKIDYAKNKIVEFVENMGGPDKVFVSFSGGKDSTVLLHLVRSIYPNIKAVFMDTGLEFPEIKEFVKRVDNVVWKKSRKTVNQVFNENGIPAVSKEVATYVNEVRTTKSDKLIEKRLNFGHGYCVPKKWIFLCDKEFIDYEISGKCCTYFKKLPSEDYIRETKEYPIVGTMVDESTLRLNSWIKFGCNMYNGKKIQSRPLSIWVEDDIWDYIERFNLDICDLYVKGYERTGCYLCPFGSHLDKNYNRYEMLKKTHPMQYKSLEKLGIKRVLMDMNVEIPSDKKYMENKQKRQNEIKEWYVKVEQDIKDNMEKSKYWIYRNYFNIKMGD